MDSFDYIIVGAGSAGCVLADRLSENGRFTVLVVEAGGSDNRFWIKVPLGDRAHPLKRYLFDAAAELGLPRTDNMNGAQTEGVGLYQINTKDGRRWSAADAFLRPALRRGNVACRSGALVTRIVIENNRAV